MDSCEEFAILMSSLQWADKIPGGLASLPSPSVDEPSYTALIETLNEICDGLFNNNTEKEKKAWSFKLTNVFMWKWLLNEKKFNHLEGMAPLIMRKFPMLNIKFSYEIIKNQKWMEHFWKVITSFECALAMEIVQFFLDEVFLAENSKLTEKDFLFFMNLCEHILNYFHKEANNFQCPRDFRLFKTTTLEKCFMIFTRYFRRRNNETFSKESLCKDLSVLLLYLNVVSMSFDSSIVDIQQDSLLVDSNAGKKILNFSYDDADTHDDSISAKVMTFQVVIKKGNCNITNEQETEFVNLNDATLEDSVNMFQNFVDSVAEGFKIWLKMNSQNDLNFTGFTAIDLCCEKILKWTQHMEKNTLLSSSKKLNEIVAIVVGKLEILTDDVVIAMNNKKMLATNNSFELNVCLVAFEQNFTNIKDYFLRMCNVTQVDKASTKRVLDCLEQNVKIIDDSSCYMKVLEFVERLRCDSEFEKIENILLGAFTQLEWSIRDEVIHEMYTLKTSRDYATSIFRTTKKLEARWKSAVNRLSDQNLEGVNEMLPVLSVHFLINVKATFEKILYEISLGSRIAGAFLLVLNRFPKTLNVKPLHGNSLFLDSFRQLFFSVSIRDEPHCKKKTNLLNFLKQLVDKFLLSSKDFATFCIMLIAGNLSAMRSDAKDLIIMEVFLESLKIKMKDQTPTQTELFAFVSIAKLIFNRIQEIQTVVIDINCGEVDKMFYPYDVVLKQKSLLHSLVDMWEAIFLSFSYETQKLRGCLDAELSNYSWFVQCHFLDSIKTCKKPVLADALQCLCHRSNVLQLHQIVECVPFLVDFCLVSDNLLDYALNNFNLENLTANEDYFSSTYECLVETLCKKWPTITDLEWSRLCRLMQSLSFIKLSSRIFENSIDCSISSNGLAVCNFMYDVLILLNDIRENTNERSLFWSSFPWNRCCQLFLIYLETSVFRGDRHSLEEKCERAAALRVCARLCEKIPVQYVINFMLQHVEDV